MFCAPFLQFPLSLNWCPKRRPRWQQLHYPVKSFFCSSTVDGRPQSDRSGLTRSTCACRNRWPSSAGVSSYNPFTDTPPACCCVVSRLNPKGIQRAWSGGNWHRCHMTSWSVCLGRWNIQKPPQHSSVHLTVVYYLWLCMRQRANSALWLAPFYINRPLYVIVITVFGRQTLILRKRENSYSLQQASRMWTYSETRPRSRLWIKDG